VLEDSCPGRSHQPEGGQLQQGGYHESNHYLQQALLQLTQGERHRCKILDFLSSRRIVLYPKTSPMVKHQFVHIDYMRAKKDMHFNMILDACGPHAIIDLLQFRHNWNQEVIAEFYSTLFFDKKERIFMWMTNSRSFHVKLSQFAQILGLSSQLDIPKKLNSGRVMMPREMTLMYIPNNDFKAPKVDGMLPHILTLHRMMRKTLAPRIGYSETILAHERNLLNALMKPMHFNVF
jgi:hypothetical protein